MSSACNKRRRFSDAGVTALEVAFVFALFVMLTLGTVDASLYLVSLQNLTSLVNGAARAGQADVTLTNCDGPPSSWSGVSAYAPLLNPNLVYLCVQQPFVPGLQTLTVTASYTYQPLTPWLGNFLGPITETVTYNY
jgi:Flp pilus assembly protein TadG